MSGEAWDRELREREARERRRQVRGLVLLALLALVFSWWRMGWHRSFPAGWWRLW